LKEGLIFYKVKLEIKDSWITPEHYRPTILPPNMPTTKNKIDDTAIAKARYLVMFPRVYEP